MKPIELVKIVMFYIDFHVNETSSHSANTKNTVYLKIITILHIYSNKLWFSDKEKER